MKNKIILNGNVVITNKVNGEVWMIKQDETNKRFYITSSKGYNGYEGKGHSSLSQSLKQVETWIKDYHVDRCLEEPK